MKKLLMIVCLSVAPGIVLHAMREYPKSIKILVNDSDNPSDKALAQKYLAALKKDTIQIHYTDYQLYSDAWNEDVNTRYRRKTALHVSAEMNCYNCIEVLLERGARIDAGTFHIAVWALLYLGYIKPVKLLLKAGAHVTAKYEDFEKLAKYSYYFFRPNSDNVPALKATITRWLLIFKKLNDEKKHAGIYNKHIPYKILVECEDIKKQILLIFLDWLTSTKSISKDLIDLAQDATVDYLYAELISISEGYKKKFDEQSLRKTIEKGINERIEKYQDETDSSSYEESDSYYYEESSSSDNEAIVEGNSNN